MFIVCYLVKISTELETMFEQLRDSNFSYEIEKKDSEHYEIWITEKNGAAWKAWKEKELWEIMQWYI